MELEKIYFILVIIIISSKLPFNTLRQKVVALFALVACLYYLYYQEFFYPVVMLIISIVLNVTDTSVDYILLICKEDV